jgi:hypothetical protein
VEDINNIAIQISYYKNAVIGLIELSQWKDLGIRDM